MSKTETVRALNKLARAMMGPPMTREQLEELERLRRQVKAGDLTVTEAQDIWDSKFNMERWRRLPSRVRGDQK